MMETVNKYSVLEWCSSQPESMEALSRWNQRVVKFLVDEVKPSAFSLLTLNPDNARSIGYDLSTNNQEGKFNSVTYLVTTLDEDLVRSITELMEADEFYLGHVLLIKGVLSKTMIENIIVYWNGNLALAGVEIFKMGSDGLCVYWYNPPSLDDAQRVLERVSVEEA